jgi:hypothetical protein
MGGPAPDSVNQANKDAGEKVTVANLDVWLHELTKKVAILEENAIAKDVIIKDLNERLSKLEKGVGSGGGSTSPLFILTISNKTTKAEVQILAKVHREIYQKKTNEANLIVSGLPAAVGGTDEETMKNDQATLESLMLVLKASPHHIGKHRRIEINGKPSLVIVDLGPILLRFCRRCSERSKIPERERQLQRGLRQQRHD